MLDSPALFFRRCFHVKARLEQLLAEALASLKASALVPDDASPEISVTRTRDASHGDFATNLAMQLAKPAKRPPREIADALIAALPANDVVREAVVAGPGFVNFFEAEGAGSRVVADVLERGAEYGRSALGDGRRVQVEFVSANPTGPLHVGHGRGAALGATIANLLDAVGFDVQREYYVNDAGRQMDILAASVWLRYLALSGRGRDVPGQRLPGGLRARRRQGASRRARGRVRASGRRCHGRARAGRGSRGRRQGGAHRRDRLAHAGAPRRERLPHSSSTRGSTRSSPTSGTISASSASSTTSGSASGASRATSRASSSGSSPPVTSTRRTACSGSGRPTSATTRTASSSGRTGRARTSPPTSPTSRTSSSAGSSASSTSSGPITTATPRA